MPCDGCAHHLRARVRPIRAADECARLLEPCAQLRAVLLERAHKARLHPLQPLARGAQVPERAGGARGAEGRASVRA